MRLYEFDVDSRIGQLVKGLTSPKLKNIAIQCFRQAYKEQVEWQKAVKANPDLPNPIKKYIG